jgi:hypothetical protein
MQSRSSANADLLLVFGNFRLPRLVRDCPLSVRRSNPHWSRYKGFRFAVAQLESVARPTPTHSGPAKLIPERARRKRPWGNCSRLHAFNEVDDAAQKGVAPAILSEKTVCNSLQSRPHPRHHRADAIAFRRSASALRTHNQETHLRLWRWMQQGAQATVRTRQGFAGAFPRRTSAQKDRRPLRSVVRRQSFWTRHWRSEYPPHPIRSEAL